jgi:hypothetical protein
MKCHKWIIIKPISWIIWYHALKKIRNACCSTYRSKYLIVLIIIIIKWLQNRCYLFLRWWCFCLMHKLSPTLIYPNFITIALVASWHILVQISTAQARISATHFTRALAKLIIILSLSVISPHVLKNL